jgi:FAD/FMN-containing dehydrogenase
VNGTLVCQTGCVLEHLDHYLSDHGHMMPLDLGAKGSCQIGGNLATNAGGLRYLRYKSLHANLLGLEVVLADGSILDNAKTIRKDNTGLHLDHLFLGSEGTLGVITKCSLQVPLKPKSVNVCLFGVDSFEKCIEIFRLAKQDLHHILSAYEFFDLACLNSVLEFIPGSQYPLEKKYPFYILLETHGNTQASDDETVADFCEKLLTSEVALDGTIAKDETQSHAIWKLRETISESLVKAGAVYKYDVSVPIEKMYDIVDIFRERLKNTKLVPLGFGHLGDDNLHLNFLAKGQKKDYELTNQIEEFLYPWIAEHNGSISAEHGLGLMKPQHLHYSKSIHAIEKMKQIKNVFDPNGILNPYKVYPDK